MRGAQLGETAMEAFGRLLTVDDDRQEVDDGVVVSELGEVLEREVDGPCDRTAPAQLVELCELPLPPRAHESRNGG